MNIEHLHIRTTDTIKTMLQAQSTAAHRSMTQQIEYLIEQESHKINAQQNLKGGRKMYTEVINASGTTINFEASVNLMDDDIREQLHDDLSPCTEQVFFAAYEAAHEAKYGEPWELSKVNPVW